MQRVRTGKKEGRKRTTHAEIHATQPHAQTTHLLSIFPTRSHASNYFSSVRESNKISTVSTRRRWSENLSVVAMKTLTSRLLRVCCVTVSPTQLIAFVSDSCVFN